MKALKVIGRFHWGYWIRGVEVSKLQYSLRVPPPTTLIGAISYPLFKIIGDKGETLSGLYSPVKKILDVVRHAVFSLNDYGMYLEDINVYILLHFQQLGGKEEFERYGTYRRYAMKYRTGAIKTGKIYAPNAEFTIIYFIDEKAASKELGSDWDSILTKACYEISRIGSKESIVSINKVLIYDVNEIKSEKVETKFYFPLYAAIPILGNWFFEKFWKGGFGKDDLARPIEYVIPGILDPIHSELIKVKISDKGFVYSVDDEVVIIGV